MAGKSGRAPILGQDSDGPISDPLPQVMILTSIVITFAVTAFLLALAAIPFFARLVETAVRDVSAGKVEAARMVGASRLAIVGGVLVREALPAIVGGITVTVITLVGYSAMAGALGAGGLGALAVNHGYNRFQTDVMVVTVVVIIVLVQLVQMLGDRVVRLVDHR